MEEIHVGIGQAAKQLSELVNRVAYKGERFVLTSRGKPKAALISWEEFKALRGESLTERLKALEKARAAGEHIRMEREAGGIEDKDSVEILRELRQERLDEISGMR
ncbi:MAG: type II toxin-antitoxin system Phd/YefM family antitoxin [Anaerolineae bacterium]